MKTIEILCRVVALVVAAGFLIAVGIMICRMRPE